jgi:hypothetical protein
MDFDKQQLDAFKLEGPGHAAESPIADAAQETFTDEADIEARRERNIHGGPQGLSDS